MLCTPPVALSSLPASCLRPTPRGAPLSACYEAPRGSGAGFSTSPSSLRSEALRQLEMERMQQEGRARQDQAHERKSTWPPPTKILNHRGTGQGPAGKRGARPDVSQGPGMLNCIKLMLHKGPSYVGTTCRSALGPCGGMLCGHFLFIRSSHFYHFQCL